MDIACEIVLVRHADSVRPSLGGPDELSRPLTPEGMHTARLLATKLMPFQPTTILSSPYLRAVQTVHPTAEQIGLDIITRWELREWDSGLGPTLDWATHYSYSWDNLDFARPDGESLQQLTVRAMAAMEGIVSSHAGGVILIGSHGTFVSRVLAGYGEAVDWPFSRDMPMPAVYHILLTEDNKAIKIQGPGL